MKDELLSQVFSYLGRRGGLSKSKAKRKAAKRNIRKAQAKRWAGKRTKGKG
jgi:hypothetical protein